MGTKAELQKVIAGRAGLWSALRARGVVISAGRAGAGAFHRPGDVPAEAARLAAAGCSAATLEALCAEIGKWQDHGGCLVDAARAASLVERQGVSAGEALNRSRVRYQGTDGVRGKVARLAPGTTPVAALVERGEFTPELAALLASAAAASAPAGPAVIASDGRETGGDGAFARAVGAAFLRSGRNVLDLGVAPTPVVPVACAALGAPLGASLTASHNPADQNGIKFFLAGRKILPEPEDYVHSARAFLESLEGPPAAANGSSAPPAGIERVDAGRLLSELFRGELDGPDLTVLRGARFIVDTAHGAYSPWAAGLLAGLGLAGRVINADMTGANINRDSGVAHIEGRERVGAEEIGPALALAAEVRAAAKSGSAPVFGISLDGDGDRGLLLVFDRASGDVRVVDGDRMAYLIANLVRRDGPAGRRLFAGTVESDLAVFEAVRHLGVETLMTPVGDKWLTARPGLCERLLVGAEPSGHVAWPVEVAAPGGRATVTAGNGLLTGLCAASAILRLGLAPERAAEPYPPGLTATFYTYFVERDRFHRGGPAWKESFSAAQAATRAAAESGQLPAGCRLREEVFPDEPDMLYLVAEGAGGERLGAVFARNSGTENKTAVYARGRRELSAGLTAVARAIRSAHVRSMRDDRLVEARALSVLVAEARRRGGLSLAEARKAAEGCGVAGEAAFFALLFAAVREDSIRRSGDMLLPV